jgi:ligand-binding sensor domain-containing protein/DNA-binding CsgD family transcriptional regulator
MLSRYLFVIAIVSATLQCFGQVKDIGLPYIKNFSKETYRHHPRNLAIAQGKTGIMYFGNGDGLLEFDSHSWNLLPMPNKSAVISLCVDEHDGTLYVGAQGEFGFIRPDSIGNISYVSLSQELPAGTPGFGDIWKIAISDGKFTAIASNMIMTRDAAHNWTIVKPLGHFFPGFAVHDRVFVFDSGKKALLEFQDNELMPLRGAEALGARQISVMVPYGERNIVIGSEDGSLFMYDGLQVVPWKTGAEEFLKANQAITGLTLPDGSIVIGTLHNGFLVIDQNGKPLQHINSSKGLQSSSILSMLNDEAGNLWLGLENGIDFVELSSPFTSINERSGLPGTGFASVYDNNRLYLGTSHGVYYKEQSGNEDPVSGDGKYKLLENSSGQVWNLDNRFGALLLGHNNGAYTIRGNKAEKIVDGGTWMFMRSDKYPEYLLAGGYSALSIFNKAGAGQWHFRNFCPDFRESFRIMEEDAQGNIWLSHPHKGLYRLVLHDSLRHFTTNKFYNASNGLPSDFSNYISKIGNTVVFLTMNGIYRFHAEQDRFEPDEKFVEYFAGKAVTKLIEDARGNVWFVADHRPGLLKKTAEGFNLSEEQFGKLEGKLVANFEHIDPIDESNVLFGTEEGFVHYDPSRHQKDKIPFFVHLRKVEDSNNEKLIWGNAAHADGKLNLPYERNALRFTFSCTSYRDLEKNRYQYMLVGFDRSWSEWTARTQKEYTNLPEGKYTFKVRARNDNQELSADEANFTFRIAPPWYRTVIAYVAYVVLSIMAMVGIVKFIARLKERQLRQEQLKAERKIVQLENEKLETEVNYKQRELASLALNITSKNEILDQIKTQVKLVGSGMDEQGRVALSQIIRLIDNSIRLDNDWEKFEFYFDQVHSNFLKLLRESYPDLTISQLKLCAYLKMNLSSKEIAILMNVSVAGVEKSRYRLRKKFNLEHELMLADFIQKLQH